MKDNEAHEVFIDEEEMAEYFFKKLTKKGYVISEKEVDDIVSITFDFLLEKTLLEEMGDD